MSPRAPFGRLLRPAGSERFLLRQAASDIGAYTCNPPICRVWLLMRPRASCPTPTHASSHLALQLCTHACMQQHGCSFPPAAGLTLPHEVSALKAQTVSFTILGTGFFMKNMSNAWPLYAVRFFQGPTILDCLAMGPPKSSSL